MSALFLCRICVSEVNEFVYLLDLYYGDVAASLFIEDILKIDISNNHQRNHSPLIICETCNSTLKHFQLFYQTVKQAQRKYLLIASKFKLSQSFVHEMNIKEENVEESDDDLPLEYYFTKKKALNINGNDFCHKVSCKSGSKSPKDNKVTCDLNSKQNNAKFSKFDQVLEDKNEKISCRDEVEAHSIYFIEKTDLKQESDNINCRQNNSNNLENKSAITSKGINNLNLEQNIPFVKKIKFENRTEHCVDLNNAIEKTNLESQCNYLSTEEEAEMPRSENATKKMFAKYKKDEIFHNGEWLLSEDQKDEILSLYVDLKCFKCNSLDFSKYKDLYEHSMKEHGEVPKLHCCRYYPSDIKVLYRHILYKHILKQKYPAKLIECPVCHKSIRSQIYQEHLSTHLPHDKREFQCDQCHAGFATRGKLNDHTKTNHSVTLIACEECGKMWKNKYALKVHMKIHSLDRHHLCPDCGKKFKDYRQFVNHINEHKGIVQKAKCHLCNAVVKKISLSRHIRGHDPKNNKQCPHCPYKGISISGHVKTVHDKVKPFACSVCPMSFSNESAMRDHVASRHTGIPLHTCEFCEKTFMSNGNYYAHCKRMHPDQYAEKKLKKAQKNYTDLSSNSAMSKKRLLIIQGPEAESVMEALKNRKRLKSKDTLK